MRYADRLVDEQVTVKPGRQGKLDQAGLAVFFERDVDDVVEVPLVGDDFCFERGVPGRASELVFGIFAAQRGRASLTVSEVTLTPD